MPYEEKPATARMRVVLVVMAWIPGAFLFVFLWYVMGWWFLVLLGPSAWATWDYLRRGDMFGAVDAGSRGGRYLPALWRKDRGGA